jgi:ATP-dependent RNA helicase SUPV3L1/SUV3
VVPDLMSVVGCSGEYFASILRSFGFKCERRKVRAEAVVAQPDVQPAADSFEDVWRPSRRKDRSEHTVRHRGKQPQGKAQHGKRKHPPRPSAPQQRPVSTEHSPFAALAELKRNLARRPERG